MKAGGGLGEGEAHRIGLSAPDQAGKRAASPRNTMRRRAALAQLVEHRIRNAGVTGSSPVSGTTSSTRHLVDLLRKGRS